MTLRVCANRIAQAGPQYSLIPEAEVPLISRGTLSQALRSATAEAAGEALETEVDSAAADQLSTYRERDGEAGTAELREYQSFLGRLQGFRTHLVAQLHDNALSFHRAIVQVCETAGWNARVIGELDASSMVGLVNVREAVKDRRLDIEAKAFARDLGLSVGGELPSYAPTQGGIREVEGGTVTNLDNPDRFAQITGHAATGHDDIRLILDTEVSHHGMTANSGSLTVNGRIVHSTRWHYLN